MEKSNVTTGALTSGGSVAVGNGNTVDSNNPVNININNLHINSPFNPSGNGSAQNQLFEQLIKETNPDSKYTVFVCAPSDNISSDKAKEIFDDIIEQLNKINIEIIVGGGKVILDKGNPYPHIYEYNLCKKSNCNAVIIIAEDHSTLSQFSLLSHLIYDSSLSKISMFTIYDDNILQQEFMVKGPISYYEDEVKGFLIPFSKYDKNIGEDICKKINKNKLFSADDKG
ncbi:hypothetical protein [Vibrio parahaemolyticus]|uniref:hypothetical protein n=1 Tax=Vibrio parahaemolyticus TaxID=670 RepID=UPI00084B81B3|nr:hypothetical protein [Vibrio parahaemolyticus]ODY82066.1 hypothetical protein BBM31_16490 [Vibrio parahaemolyticus]